MKIDTWQSGRRTPLKSHGGASMTTASVIFVTLSLYYFLFSLTFLILYFLSYMVYFIFIFWIFYFDLNSNIFHITNLFGEHEQKLIFIILKLKYIFLYC